MDNSTPETPVPQEPVPPSPQPQQQPAPQIPEPPQPSSSGNPIPPVPGQVIGAGGAIPSSSTAAPTTGPTPPQSVARDLSPEPPQAAKKKWVLPVAIGIILLILIAIAAILFLNSKDKDNNTSPSQKPSSAASVTNTSSSDETSSWKTYSDKLITLKYPPDWAIKPNATAGGGNFNITPPGDPDASGYLGEDNFTDNAKTNDSKTYWQTAYNSDNSLKIVAENSDSVSGYDTYNVEARDSTRLTTYSIVGKSGLKITFYYPTNNKNNDTFESIVNTLRIN
ncbi:MAG TPA: hypothetical protein VFW77_02280 [Candidatus Saccharimonadales bacterium]|nr:hypothetical protein [Candidatus Saccharimonadales bacterium]